MPYYRANFRRVIASRQFLSEKLADFGFEVCPSQTNFIFVRPPAFPADVWLQRLRERKVLVRWFSAADVRDYLRISIGTDAEVKKLLSAVRKILAAS